MPPTTRPWYDFVIPDELDPEKRAGFEALAASYRRMAEQTPHEAGLIGVSPC
jgi:hypothetical protein